MEIFSYLLTFMGVLFWIFRAIATLMFQLDREFFAQPLNVNMEIAVLFLTLPCLILVIKRNIIGAALYLAIYITYFGSVLFEAINNATVTGFNLINSADMLCTFIGVIIPVLTFIDILFNKNRNAGGGSAAKKTDWYYKNKDYDREFDERADRNQYKF